MIFHFRFRVVVLMLFVIVLGKSSIAQNFHLVKDINASKDGYPYNYSSGMVTKNTGNEYAILNGVSYFGADDGIHGRSLWRTDGTEAGTYMVKDGVEPNNITVSNGKLFFVGKDNPGLWKSDGTKEGTVKVLDEIPSGLYEFIPYGLTDFNGTLYFAITRHNFNDQLWKTDGTSAGTVLVKDFFSQVQENMFGYLADFTVIKNKIYFRAVSFFPIYDAVLGVSDGSAIGTHIISKNLFEPAQMIACSANNNDSSVYFTAFTNNQEERSLYVTNGDSGNVKIPRGFAGFTSISYWHSEMASIGSTLYFSGRVNTSGKSESLYKYDAIGGDVQPVKTLAGSNSSGKVSSISNPTNIDGTLYFSLFDAVTNKKPGMEI